MTPAAEAYGRVLMARAQQQRAAPESAAGSTRAVYSIVGASLWVQGGLICPQCSTRTGRPVVHPSGNYRVYGQEPQYRTSTTTVYRCGACRYLFAPLPPVAVPG